MYTFIDTIKPIKSTLRVYSFSNSKYCPTIYELKTVAAFYHRLATVQVSRDEKTLYTFL